MITRAPLPQVPTPPAEKPFRFIKWHRRVLGFCLVIFAFELGVFLVVFPWLNNWDLSWVPVHSPRFGGIWMSRYFRGALTGLGLLDLWVAVVELVKQLKDTFRRN